MPRVTINDIARRAGVSKGAVSYALNGRPGVSESTRARILQIAAELGWAPNRTARLLSGSRTDTIGLILARPARTLSTEPFYMEFVGGIESELSPRSYALLLQLAKDQDEEIATYRRWWSERRIDAVILVDLQLADRRIEVLRELEIPTIVVTDPAQAPELMSVWTDDAVAMQEAVDYLVSLGHTQLARVAGFSGMVHVARRDDAFTKAVAETGTCGQTIHTDFTSEAGRQAAQQLLAGDVVPTAIVFDNDLMAVAGLSAMAEAGVRVPDEMSVLAWDDSPLCEITHPQLSAMSHDVFGLGAEVARRLFSLLDGADPVATTFSKPSLLVRGSTAPPPGSAIGSD